MARQPTRRQARAAARREELLKTAFQLFAERGYRGTSVRDIARAVGVNEGLLYHYFDNKAELFAAVLARYAPFEAGSDVLESSEGHPVRAVLHDLGQQFLRQMQERRAFIATILSEASANPELGHILGEFLRGTRARIAEFLARRQATGEIEAHVDAETAAQAFVGALLFETLSRLFYVQDHALPAVDSAVVDSIIAVLSSGLNPTRPDRTI